jgi:hypothetical protein
MIAPFGRLSVALAVLFAFLAAADRSAQAQTNVEYKYEDVGNTRYLVTERTVQRAVPKTDWLEQQQTVYQERYETQWQTNYRTYLTPVTEYRQELYLANRWNPLAVPYWSYRYVPVTRWEARQEPYNVPITQRTWVPEQRTVRIPQTTVQLTNEQQISKVAVGPAPTDGTIAGSPQTAVARRVTVGGVQKLE